MTDNLIKLNNDPGDIDQLKNIFSNYLSRQEKSNNTIKSYVQDLKTFNLWWTEKQGFDQFRPGMINKQDIIDYKKFMQENYSPTTINRKITSLKSFYRMCKDLDYTNHDPIENIKYIDYESNNSPKSLTEEDKRNLIEVANNNCNKRDKAIISILMSCGLRVGELIDLDKDNFDQQGFLSVWGKGNKHRRVPIPKGVVNNIRKYLSIRKDDIKALFISERRNRIAYTTVRYMIKKLFAKAGIENASIHTLRHTAAYDMAKKHNLNYIKKILGHSDISTTMIYVEPRDDDLQNVVSDLDYF